MTSDPVDWREWRATGEQAQVRSCEAECMRSATLARYSRNRRRYLLHFNQSVEAREYAPLAPGGAEPFRDLDCILALDLGTKQLQALMNHAAGSCKEKCKLN